MSLHRIGKVVECRIEESTIQPLVSAVTASPPTAPINFKRSRTSQSLQPSSRYKGLTLILLWNVIVGFIYGSIQVFALAAAVNPEMPTFRTSVYVFLGIFGTLAVGQMIFYPLSGLLADLKYGRYKTVTGSQVQITLAFLILCVIAVIALKDFHKINHPRHENLLLILISIGSILMLLGFAGFQSNAVQFGLDQLLDAPSKHLSLFLWWYVWTGHTGEMVARLIGSAGICKQNLLKYYLSLSIIIFATLTSVLLLLGCWKHQWFYCEVKTYNPYGQIYRVLKFVAKTKHPLQRSALTYCDDILPSRMDFAKHKYGGPFTTEVVEDVKTFLRILLMLFLVTPFCYYTIPGLNAFPIYALHMGRNVSADQSGYCYSEWIILQSGNLSFMVGFVAMPVYVLLFRSCLQKWLSRILHRFILGTVIVVLYIWSMTTVYAAAVGYAHHQQFNISCLFTSEYRHSPNFSQTMEFSAYSLIPPNVIGGLGLPIIKFTVLEFISAQSPHTMKGLVLGIFYTLRGFFILMGCITVFPFTAKVLDWSQTSLYLECGFLYYVLNALVGVVIIFVAIVAVRWYKYRQREDKPYDHTYVEEYYSRYARRGQDASLSDEEETPPYQSNSNSIDYGSAR